MTKLKSFWDYLSDRDLVTILLHTESEQEAFKMLGVEQTGEHKEIFKKRTQALGINLPKVVVPGVKYRGKYTVEYFPLKDKEAYENFFEEIDELKLCSATIGASSIDDIFLRLGVGGPCVNIKTLLTKAKQYHVDLTRFKGVPLSSIPHRRLENAVANATTYAKVLTNLRHPYSKKRVNDIQVLIENFDINTNHFLIKWSDVTKEQFEEAFSKYTTLEEIAVFLRCTNEGNFGGSNAVQFYKRLNELGIEIPLIPTRKELKDLGSTPTRRIWLLTQRGHQCEECLRTEHHGTKIPLEMHHKDRDRDNNVEENLLLLCGNCHKIEHKSSLKKTFTQGTSLTFETTKSIAGKRLHLIQERGNICEKCTSTTWEKHDIPLDLHHVDMDRLNNNRDNLSLLCTNCHLKIHKAGQTIEELRKKKNQRRKKALAKTKK